MVMSKAQIKSKTQRRIRRKRHIRHRVSGSETRPRMTVFRSLSHIYVQIIDDDRGATLCAASTAERDLRSGATSNASAAEKVGRLVAERAKEKGVTSVVFDRNGYKFHGRVKALADAARAGGLEF